MTNLDDLKIFERVAALKSFTDAGRAMEMTKSTVSRTVSRLEDQLGMRLLHRNTHSVRLTEAGIALQQRCASIFTQVNEAIDYVSGLNGVTSGTLNISATIGFSYFALCEILPAFLEQHPKIRISLNLTSSREDVVARGMDVAIRIGKLSDSRLVAIKLGTMQRYLCASPSYLKRRGLPKTIAELKGHSTVGALDGNGIPYVWRFYKDREEVAHFSDSPGLLVNDPGMIYQFVSKGAGIGGVPGYLCASDILAGRLTRLFPQWTMQAAEVSLVYASRRGMSPAIRAFIAHMTTTAAAKKAWLDDPLEKRSSAAKSIVEPIPRSKARQSLKV